MLKARGRHADLLASYRAELEVTPDNADIHNDIGALLHSGGVSTAGDVRVNVVTGVGLPALGGVLHRVRGVVLA